MTSEASLLAYLQNWTKSISFYHLLPVGQLSFGWFSWKSLGLNCSTLYEPTRNTLCVVQCVSLSEMLCVTLCVSLSEMLCVALCVALWVISLQMLCVSLSETLCVALCVSSLEMLCESTRNSVCGAVFKPIGNAVCGTVCQFITT